MHRSISRRDRHTLNNHFHWKTHKRNINGYDNINSNDYNKKKPMASNKILTVIILIITTITITCKQVTSTTSHLNRLTITP